MSEYIEIETEISEDGLRLYVFTNLQLAEGEAERYASAAAMEEGSPVAQALAVVAGMAQLQIDGRDLTITREAQVDWHVIVAEVTAVLKDFFL